MSDLQKGRTILLAALRAIEELTIENEALWNLLRETWPHYYQQKKYMILEQAVEQVKADPRVTGSLRESFARSREQIQSGIDLAEVLEALKKFPPKGGAS